MLGKVGRLFVIKTRFEAFAVIYALALGAVERGHAYLGQYPGFGGKMLFAAATGAVFRSALCFWEEERAWQGVAHEAAHAWAEVHVAGLGWVGFDPANRCCPDDRYIRLGSGLDAQDAAPIRGIARGVGAESLDVTVAVQALQQ